MHRFLISTFILLYITSCTSANLPTPGSITNTPPAAQNTAVSNPANPTPTLANSPTSTFTPSPSPTPTVTPTITPTPLPWGTVEISAENAPQIVNLATWGRGDVIQYEFTKDGKLLVLSSLGVYLYTAEDYSNLIELPGAIRYLVSPDQSRAAVLYLDGAITIVNLSTAEKMYDLVYIPDMPGNFCEGCDERTLAMFAWEFYSFAPMAFSDDLTQFAAAAMDGSIIVWNMQDGAQMVRLYHDAAGMDQDILFTPDGQHLISIGRNPIAYVRKASLSYWSIAEGKMLWYQKESGRLDARLFSPDGSLMGITQGIFGLDESVVRLFQVKDGAFVGQINGQISDEPFSPDSKSFISYHPNNVMVWKLQPEFILMRTVYPAVEVQLAKISEDGLHLEINGGELDYLLSDYQVITQGEANLPEPEPVREIEPAKFASMGHLGPASGMVLTEDQQLFVWGGTQQVWRWSPLDGLVDWIGFETEPMAKPVLSPDGESVAACSKENLSIAYWHDSSSTSFERCLQKGILAFSPAEPVIAYAFSNQLRTIDPQDGQTIQDFYGPGYQISWLKVARDGRLIASGGMVCTMGCKGDLHLWNVEKAKGVSLESDGSEWPVTNVVFTSDSQKMIVAKRFIWIWDTEDGRLQGRFAITGIKLALSPDDQILAVADQDGVIHLLNMNDREEIVSWESNQQSIISLAFTADGKSLLSLAEDGSLKLWGLH